MKYFWCTLLACIASARLKANNVVEISVLINGNQNTYQVVEGIAPNADVTASYMDGMSSVGWGLLNVTITNKQGASISDTQRMYAAGLAEGYLTSERIYETYMNTYNVSGLWDFTNGPSAALREFLNTQQQYMDSQIEAHSSNDQFWWYAKLLQEQFNGLWFGYNLSITDGYVKQQNESMIPIFNSSWPLQFLNLVGDLLDLMSALNQTLRVDYNNYLDRPNEYWEIMQRRGRCSALIKMAPLLDDMFIGHSSWFIFQNANRLFKRYKFTFQSSISNFPTKHMMFSSYPGYLESLDDFYVMDSGLAMLQTTNGIPNATLYDLVTPYSLFAWQRVRIANALSTSGEEWHSYVSRENSGTYNNQYMVINYGSFTPNEPLPDNMLWVVEQIPGLVAGQDMTNILRRGYFASYNVPAIEEIYDKSGYPAMVEAMGVNNSYDLAPRARIFRRDANNVLTFEEYKSLLRYNNYLVDPIENGSPMWAICSRGDLLKEGASPFGCYDSKASNYSMILNMQAEIINGPTYDDLPPFDWNDWPATPHAGINTLMQYPWILV